MLPLHVRAALAAGAAGALALIPLPVAPALRVLVAVVLAATAAAAIVRLSATRAAGSLDAPAPAADAAERLRAEQDLVLLGRIARGMGHEMNNLLTAILGHADVLATRVGSSPESRRDLDAIVRAAESAAAVARQLRSFTRRGESRASAPSPQVVDDVVRALDRLLGRVFPSSVTREAALHAPGAAVLARPGALEHVLAHLALNARDAMPEGGRFALATRVAGGSLVLRVEDTGHGMDAATLARALEPHVTTKPAGQGNGLGLASVADEVAAMGGTIALASEPGRGTTCTLELPLAARAATPVPEGAQRAIVAAPAADGASHATVLVVDDDASVRRFMAEALRHAGHAVVEAPDGETALAILEANDPPVSGVVTDVGLPGMSGVEMLRRAREHRPLLPALYVTGCAGDADVVRGAPHEAPSLTKPFRTAALLDAVATMLGTARGPADGGGGSGRSG